MMSAFEGAVRFVGRTGAELYLFEGVIKCRKCHGLEVSTIAYLEEKLHRAQNHYEDYEARKRYGLKYAWKPLGEATKPKHLRKRIARLKRQIAAEKLKMWAKAPIEGQNSIEDSNTQLERDTVFSAGTGTV
jgi:hypothetical protein